MEMFIIVVVSLFLGFFQGRKSKKRKLISIIRDKDDEIKELKDAIEYLNNPTKTFSNTKHS
mgnify:FL=1